MEATVMLFMVSDVAIYTITHGCQINTMNVTEWLIIFAYVSTFGFILRRGLNTIDEEFELALFVFRFLIQSVRIGIGILRIKENREKRNANIDIDFDIGTDNEGQEPHKDDKNIALEEFA